MAVDLESNVCPCGAEFGTGPGTGYALTSDGRTICYDCAHQMDIAGLKNRTKPFAAYVGAGENANLITTWTGRKLMVITSSRPCQLTRFSFTHDRKSYRSIHAVDVHGGHWHGRGSAGICITLRPCKSPKR